MAKQWNVINDGRGADLRASLRDASADGQRQPSDESLGYSRAVPTGRRVTARYIHRRFDGVDIETQRGAETAWTYLAFDSSSPYIDNRPPATAGQAEQRRYRMRYRDDDVQVGVFSDTLTVTVGP